MGFGGNVEIIWHFDDNTVGVQCDCGNQLHVHSNGIASCENCGQKEFVEQLPDRTETVKQ